MPRAPLTAGAYRDDTQVDRFEALKLETDDIARLWVPNEALGWMELVHTLRAPIFEENGRPVMTVKKVGKSGGFKDVLETDFIGRPICLGDPKVILGDPKNEIRPQELDPAECPACDGIKKMLDAGISEARDMRPQRRFALPVIRYNCQNRKSADKLQNPPGGQVLVWALSQFTYRKLDDARSMIADLLQLEGGVEAAKLQMCDLAVHCDSGSWQTLDRIWALRPAWGLVPVKEMIRALWGTPENRPTDAQLRAACGREPDRDWMARDLEDAAYRWDKAVNYGKPGHGPAVPATVAGGTGSLDADLDSLLADAPPPGEAPDDPLADHPGGLDEFAARTPAPAAAPAAPLPTADDLFADVETAPAAAPAAEPELLFDPAPAAPPAATVPPAAAAPAAANGNGAGTVASFDDIFAAAEAPATS